MSIGNDAEPTKEALELLKIINKEIERMNFPENWIVRKVWKDFQPQQSEDGNYPYKANSWVMNIYVNDSLNEDLYVQNHVDLNKFEIAKGKLLNKLAINPKLARIEPNEVKTKY